MGIISTPIAYPSADPRFRTFIPHNGKTPSKSNLVLGDIVALSQNIFKASYNGGKTLIKSPIAIAVYKLFFFNLSYFISFKYIS